MKDFACSFCGTERKKVHKLVSGPMVFVCEACAARMIREARKLGADPIAVHARRTTQPESTFTPLREPAGVRCRFCGRADETVELILSGPGGASICSGCLGLCHEILVEELGPFWMRDTG